VNVEGQLPTATQLAGEMKVGWNLGNTLEAICGETAWGNPVATQSLINSVKAAGFNTIRIPVSWDCHSTSNVIDAAWLARVKTVVDYCMTADLYVIINIHWDNGWLENNVTTSAQASVNAKQQAYWTQIANYFKTYDERVLFASANEPNVEDATGMSVLLSYHQTFINAVRATGGNNSSRTLVIQGPSTDIAKTNTLMNTMPTDQIANRLMVEIHYYTPWNFCGLTTDEWWGSQFFYWGNGNHSTIEPSRNATWGEESELDGYFTQMKTKFVDEGIPVILGEYGAIKRTNPADMTKHVASRQYYNKYVTGSAIAKGMIPCYWDNGASDFALFNRTTGAVIDQGVLDAIMEGAGGNPEQNYTLSTNVTGSGTISRNPTGTTYPGGTSVTLTANAAAGYDFLSWSGDLNSTSNPATIVMSSNKTVTANFVPEGTGGTGTILREYWSGVSGTAVSDLTSNANYPNNPTGSEQITSLEGPTNTADTYGTRIRGYIHPPVTGSYTFWLAGDDYSNLYLSTSDNPANATRIAYIEGWTNSREWNKYTSQKSAATNLTAGQKYYIEVLHKEAYGGDNIAVAWQGPGITQTVIAGSYLSPYSGTGNIAVTGVSVTPTSSSMAVNGTSQLTATVAPANATNKSVTWTSGNTSVATVSTAGLVTGRAAGSSVITVRTADGGFTATSTITVTSSNVPVTGVSVTPTSASIAVDGTRQLTATVAPANATNKSVTWTSGNTSVATVSTAGLVTGRATGSSVITVRTADGGFTATSTITVTTTTVPVTGVSVTPASASIVSGNTQQLTATVLPSNATNKSVTWTSSNTGAATVSTSGLVTGVSAGSSVITVRTADGGYTATSTITVTGGGSGCTNPVNITIPFVKEGPGEFCWFTSTTIDYINSWALTELTINGVDYTNKWSNSLPAAQNGGWTIHYRGNYQWSHFEAPKAKEATNTREDNGLLLYPNPFSESVNLIISDPEEIISIMIFDQLGRKVETINQISPSLTIGQDFDPGIYIIQVESKGHYESYRIIKSK